MIKKRFTPIIKGMGVALGVAPFVYLFMIRPWHLRWGATEAEVRQPMPGDDLVDQPQQVATRALTINAPASVIWPWLVQMGYQRAGWYSYDCLEDDDLPVTKIIPEWQQLKVGDVMLVDGQKGLKVEAIEPEQLLVLSFCNGTVALSAVAMLIPLDEQHTRLVVRLRARFKGFRGRLFDLLFEPGDFVMMRKMMLGLKARAEQAWAATGVTGTQLQTLLDKLLPMYEFRGAVSTVIHASPREIFQAVQEVTPSEMPLAIALGELRYLPVRLTGHPLLETPQVEPFIQTLLATGNSVLAEEPERELVIGSIGKFHQLTDQEFQPFQGADAFMDFNQPDFQKLAISFRLMGTDPTTGYRFTLEHRTHSLSPSSRQKFGFYWLAIKPGGNFLSWLLLQAIKRRAERSVGVEPALATVSQIT